MLPPCSDHLSLCFLVIPAATGKRTPLDEVASDIDSSDEEQTNGYGDVSDQGTQHHTTELQQMFSDLVDIINSLYRLGMTIRNVTPHDRLVKASSVDMSL
jgi:hypothetical protein